MGIHAIKHEIVQQSQWRAMCAQRPMQNARNEMRQGQNDVNESAKRLQLSLTPWRGSECEYTTMRRRSADAERHSERNHQNATAAAVKGKKEKMSKTRESRSL